MNSNRKPNWNKWRHIPDVKLWQAVALSLDIDPDKVEINRDSWMGDGLAFNEPKEFKDRIAIAKANSGRHKALRATALNIADKTSSEIQLDLFPQFARSVDWTLPEQFQGRNTVDKEKWRLKDGWSERQLQDLLCGLEPDGARPSTQETNEAIEAIRVAAGVMGVLKAVEISDPKDGDVLYYKSRFFDPEVAIRWATSKPERFPRFPFSLADTPAKTDEQTSSTERANLDRIIGGLVKLFLTENAKQKDKPLFTKQDAIISTLREQKLCELSESKLQKVFAQANKVMAE